MRSLMLVVSGLIVFVAAGVAFSEADAQTLRKVKSGQKRLACEFHDGKRKVEAHKIKDYRDGRWFFENGSASNCELLEVGYTND